MDKIDELLSRRVEKIYPSKKALEKLLRSGKKIKLYQGFDPSTPNLHIGHLVGLLKLSEFQKLGHEVIFLIGDFTGIIGDPSGKESTRKKMTRKEVLANAQTYKEQAEKILDFKGSNPVKILFNSQWNSQLRFADVLELFSHVTTSQLIERDMFRQRIKKGKQIWLHELCYPIIQGYDSVAMDVDLEIGGTDQMFNMMIGRTLVKKVKNKEKFVLTTPLLTDSRGSKIGKTEGNAINLKDEPADFYGKIMSLPDSAIIACFTLITEAPLDEIEKMEKDLARSDFNPMVLKKKLAFELTAMVNSKERAEKAQLQFEKTVQKGQLPSDIREWETKNKSWNVIDLLVETKMCPSKSEAKRLVKQGGIKVDGKKLGLWRLTIEVSDGMIVQAGKRRFLKIKLK